MKIISLGAGVQSSTLLLMALKGELGERPNCAIFADTGWEPKAVYKWLQYLEVIAEEHRFPIFRVGVGDIKMDTLRGHLPSGGDNYKKAFLTLPVYATALRSPDDGEVRLRRQCTREYKVKPLREKTKEILKAAGEKTCEMWIGISLDEVQRMRDSNVKYIKNVYPLVDRYLRRSDCLLWMERNGYPVPPRSACIGCPMHNNHEWRKMRDEAPEEFQEAVEFDRAIRVLPRIKGEAYLHRKLIPLDEVDLSTDEDHGQWSIWSGECEGLCGV